MIVNESLVVHGEVRTDVGDDIVAFINGDKEVRNGWCG